MHPLLAVDDKISSCLESVQFVQVQVTMLENNGRVETKQKEHFDATT